MTLEGVVYRRLRRLGPRRYPGARGLIAAVQGFDLVHVHGLDGLADVLVSRRRAVGAPIGISTHGGFLHTDRHPRLKDLWVRTLTRRTLNRADAVWYTSRADQESYARTGVVGTVMTDGIDVEELTLVKRRPEAGRWLVPGRIDVHKGIDDLIDVLALLKQWNTEPFHVEITGSGRVSGLVDSLMEQAKRCGVGECVSFVGVLSRADLLDHLGTAELALFPSRYEGFGIAAVEAMAAGVPVVCADIPAFRERVEDGVDGYIAPFTRPGEAAEILCGVRGRDHTRCVEQAQARSQDFSWDAMEERWRQAYSTMRSAWQKR